MVLMPKALANVRSVKHQGKEPFFAMNGSTSASGEPILVEFSPEGRVARDKLGAPVNQVFELSYGLGSDLWVRFIAKVALGCAARILPDGWLDEPLAHALRSLLWHGRIDNGIWPHGVPGSCGELEADDPARLAVGDGRHMIGLLSDDAPTGFAFSYLFGRQLACASPLPGLVIDGGSAVWVLDWRVADPPKQEA